MNEYEGTGGGEKWSVNGTFETRRGRPRNTRRFRAKRACLAAATTAPRKMYAFETYNETITITTTRRERNELSRNFPGVSAKARRFSLSSVLCNVPLLVRAKPVNKVNVQYSTPIETSRAYHTSFSLRASSHHMEKNTPKFTRSCYCPLLHNYQE